MDPSLLLLSPFYLYVKNMQIPSPYSPSNLHFPSHGLLSSFRSHGDVLQRTHTYIALSKTEVWAWEASLAGAEG